MQPRNSEDDDDQLDDVPLHHKRPFGTGLNRKPIAFVPASEGGLNTTDPSTKARSSPNIGGFYLSLVLPRESRNSTPASAESPQVCEVCKLPLAVQTREQGQDGLDSPSAVRHHHESSLAHQVCLSHSHPPSALDRSRMGLNYLESHGWDPDARAGLGAAEQGIQFPIKPKPKEDTLGLGLEVPKNLPKKQEKPQKLDAGRVRKKAQEDRKRAERIQRQFYSNSDVEKYLGTG
ncbi:hypothetical protein DL546_002544 [Coniochaeta pulveracea]|uniref:G-patch domain-containing protein n=1 Tax=Coniochaeta pulveracea TaxID=177199 RepID=A0A420YD12_9PEZI|nr:hypothetical protein DL546_002544 [Coniochaeta pulveracea]